MTFDLLFGGTEQKKQSPKLELIDMIEDYLLLDYRAYREKYRDIEFESRELTDDERTAVSNLQSFKDDRKGFWDLPFLNDYNMFLHGTQQVKKMLLKEKSERKD